MNREEFIALYGNFFSRCSVIDSHTGHEWNADPARPNLWFWCDGEPVDSGSDTLDFRQGLGGHEIDLNPRGAQERQTREHAREMAEGPVGRYVREQSEKSTEVVRWADEAMFKAEPIDAATGPRVYLLWMTPDPLGAIAAACKMYKGEVVRNLSDVTDAERLEYFAQVQKTKLKAPFEFVKFHFMIEGVTRAFTHQMVRQRTAAYAQESLRFAVKEDMPVGLPPSLAGTEDWWAADEMPDVPRTQEEAMRERWEAAIAKVRQTYSELVNDMGMPAEDARGLLPHNVLTRLHYTTDLRALLDHAGNRLCTQAQFEWRLVFAKIIEAIRDIGVASNYGWNNGKPYTVGLANGTSRVWMARELLDAFKPVCFQTGKCEFKANFDRHCNIRERVDANAEIGRDSSEWDKWHHAVEHEPSIAPIKPGEWLLDSGAARKKSR